jgi:hypothetical protein
MSTHSQDVMGSWTSTDMLLYNILHMHIVHLVQLCSINGLLYCHLPPFCIDLFGHEPCICCVNIMRPDTPQNFSKYLMLIVLSCMICNCYCHMYFTLFFLTYFWCLFSGRTYFPEIRFKEMTQYLSSQKHFPICHTCCLPAEATVLAAKKLLAVSKLLFCLSKSCFTSIPM